MFTKRFNPKLIWFVCLFVVVGIVNKGIICFGLIFWSYYSSDGDTGQSIIEKRRGRGKKLCVFNAQ